MSSFADMLKESRSKAGLSQWQLSDICGVSRSLLANIELGKRTPPPEKLEGIISALKLTDEDAAAFRQAAGASHVPEELRDHYQEELERTRSELAELREKLTDEGKIAGFLRASLAVAHAAGRGVNLDLNRIAAENGLDYLDLARAIHNNGGSLEALVVAADVLDVSPGWLLHGEDDPPWYLDLMRSVELPTAPGWAAEVRRIRGRDPSPAPPDADELLP